MNVFGKVHSFHIMSDGQYTVQTLCVLIHSFTVIMVRIFPMFFYSVIWWRSILQVVYSIFIYQLHKAKRSILVFFVKVLRTTQKNWKLCTISNWSLQVAQSTIFIPIHSISTISLLYCANTKHLQVYFKMFWLISIIHSRDLRFYPSSLRSLIQSLPSMKVVEWLPN